MTSFSALEASLEGSRPVELFTFSLGPVSWDYTSSADDVTVAGRTFVAVPLTRTALAIGTEDRGRTTTFTLPASLPFPASYIATAPGQKATVSVFGYQRDESPAPPLRLKYRGTVAEVSFPENGAVAEVVTRSVEAGGLGRSLPRYGQGAQCEHVLYGPGCGVNPAPFQVIGPVSVETGALLTVPAASSKPDGYFLRGVARLTTGGDYRLIVAHTGGGVIRLTHPFPSAVIGADLQLQAGCDHLYEGGCAFYANQGNYSGKRWTPNKNVFATGLR